MTKTLAIFSPNQNVYSETFIQAHKQLPFNIKYYSGATVPTDLENGNSLLELSLPERIEKKLNQKFSVREYALLFSLKREQVDAVLAEYGVTAADTLNVVKHLQLPLIVHFHGYDASMHTVLSSYAGKYKEVFAYANAVVAVSEKMKENLIAIGCPKDKILVNACGPNPSFFTNEPAYATQHLLAIGRFVEKKAPHLTILAFAKALASHPNAKLTMVGDGPLLPICKQLVNGLGISDSVNFPGMQPPEKIMKLLEQSIAFVQHSIIAENGDAEGTPVAVLEALAAALPVISTYHAGIPDVVIHNETGLLAEEQDVEAMAEHIIRILSDHKLAEKLGQAGRLRIKNGFTLEKHLGKLSDLIRESFDKK